MVKEASAAVEYIHAKNESKTEIIQKYESNQPKQDHSFMGLITMERLIESILNISIKDEKDTDRSQLSDSCANSMMG